MKYSLLIASAAAVNIKSSWTAEWGSGETGLIDALTPPEKDCEERLW
jgi:hypothetical protein